MILGGGYKLCCFGWLVRFPYMSNPSCSHHLLYACIPGLRTTSSQTSIIGRITIYCTAIFYLFRIYSSTFTIPASGIASFKVRYSQLHLRRLYCCFSVSRQATLY